MLRPLSSSGTICLDRKRAWWQPCHRLLLYGRSTQAVRFRFSRALGCNAGELMTRTRLLLRILNKVPSKVLTIGFGGFRGLNDLNMFLVVHD